MNNEENKSKELRDSIDRMADVLAKVIKTAQSAYDKIAHVELREGSGAAWRMLCVAVCELRHTLRPKPGTAAFLTEITDYYCEHEPRLRLMPENEKPDAAPEAGQKTPDPIAESIKRMQGVLDEVESNVRAVRFLVSGMESEQLKWAQLSRACGTIHEITRLGWQNLTEKPEVFHSPKEIIDFVTANPPLGEVKDAPTPIDPSAPEMVNVGGMRPKTDEDHMSRPEAAHILCRMSTSRKVDVDGVVALQMGVRSLMKRHFDKQRNLAIRRARVANAEMGDLCHED